MTLLLQSAGRPADGSGFWSCAQGLIPFWPEYAWTEVQGKSNRKPNGNWS